MGKKTKYLLFIVVFILSGCSVTSIKWRIKWDKDKKQGKEAFFEESKSKERDQ